MKRTILLGTDTYIKYGVEPLLKRGEITPEQYIEVLKRNSMLPMEVRKTKVYLEE